VLGLAWVVARLAAWRGVDPAQAAAFVALNPLVLVHVVGGAHNDGLAMLPATIGVAALVVRREASAGASLVASAAIKSSSLFVAPFAVVATARDSMLTGRKVLHIRSFRPINRLAAGALAAAIAIGVAGYLAFGWEWLHAFGLAGENQGRTSHLSIPVTFARLTATRGVPHAAMMSWPMWVWPVRAAPKPSPKVYAPATGKTIEPAGAGVVEVVGSVGVVVVPGAPTPPLWAKAVCEPSTETASAAAAMSATRERGVGRTCLSFDTLRTLCGRRS